MKMDAFLRAPISKIALAVVAAAGLWYWAVAIYAPANAAKVQSSGRPAGNNSDLYARWYGTRELLLHGRDPYSREVTREIQAGFYGRPLDPATASDPKQQEGFAYPLYVAFVMAPFASLPFSTVQEIFRWLLLMAIALSVPLWVCALGTRVSFVWQIVVIVLALGSYPAVMEFYQQNLAALIIFLLAAAAASVACGWLVLAGFLLALANIKPEISGLMIAWFLFWSLMKVRERGRLALSFAFSAAALVYSAQLYLPHWPRRFLESLQRYAKTESDPSILQTIFPDWLAVIIGAGLLALVAWNAWSARRSEAGSDRFSWTLALVCTSTLVLIPKIAAYNQLILVPAFLLLLTEWDTTRTAGLLVRSTNKAVFVCQLWQWGTAVLLAAASLLVPLHTLKRVAALPLATLLALPAVAVLAVVVTTSHARTVEYKS